MLTKERIELKYRWALVKIHSKKNWRMARLWVAGKLVKLAFRVSPDLRKEMGYRA